MKFATAKEHRTFFQKHGWIEFENFLSDVQIASINQAIDLSLAERLNVPIDRARLLPSDTQFLQGRDLWRLNSVLEKTVLHRHFAEVVIELIEKKTLRLGYDQFFPPSPAPSEAPLLKREETVYSRFLNQPDTLEHVSCVQGIVAGLLFSLGGGKGQVLDKSDSEKEGINVFPRLPGSAILFRPDVVINWSSIYACPGERYYLIAYTLPSSRYILEPRDPHTHALKRLGYVFNDKLNDLLHPVIYR